LPTDQERLNYYCKVAAEKAGVPNERFAIEESIKFYSEMMTKKMKISKAASDFLLQCHGQTYKKDVNNMAYYLGFLSGWKSWTILVGAISLIRNISSIVSSQYASVANPRIVFVEGSRLSDRNENPRLEGPSRSRLSRQPRHPEFRIRDLDFEGGFYDYVQLSPNLSKELVG
jgi:hypothetical protein